jgi:hypothetical protein
LIVAFPDWFDTPSCLPQCVDPLGSVIDREVSPRGEALRTDELAEQTSRGKTRDSNALAAWLSSMKAFPEVERIAAQ